MKNFFSTMLLLTAFTLGISQIITPNTGESYTLNDLYNLAPYQIYSTGPNAYTLSDDLIISSSDALVIDGNQVLNISEDVLITVQGELTTIGNSVEDPVVITAEFPETPHQGIRIEEGAYVSFENTLLSYGGGIKVLTTDFEMNNCIVQYQGAGASTGGAISFSRGMPIIQNSTFYRNDMPAISSGANQTVAAQIIGCTFQENVQSNENRPQINLAASGSENHILIQDNQIIGDRSKEMVGGIAIANFYENPNRVWIVNNTIRDNRYGLTLFGTTDVAIIDGNVIEDNNTQNDPMQGGSGINIYAVSDEIQEDVYIKNNQIRGNLWGITLQENAYANLGDDTDVSPGGNVFSSNGNNGEIYALYNNTSNALMARQNCWIEGEDFTLDQIEEVIFHQVDDASLGLVDFQNFYCLLGVVESISTPNYNFYPNPSYNEIYVPSTQAGELLVYNVQGQWLKSFSLESGSNLIQHNLRPGVYFIQIRIGNSVTNDKLIVR